MVKSKKIKEERIEIVSYYIDYDLDYKSTTKINKTSDANVFNRAKNHR